jgi:hypothetical protein
MTRAWIRLVAAARKKTPHTTSFGEFASAHPELFDKDALLKHYSKERLESAAARTAWLEPDLCALPERAEPTGIREMSSQPWIRRRLC